MAVCLGTLMREVEEERPRDRGAVRWRRGVKREEKWERPITASCGLLACCVCPPVRATLIPPPQRSRPLQSVREGLSRSERAG